MKIEEEFSERENKSIEEEGIEEVEEKMRRMEKYVDEIDSQSLDKKKLNRLLKVLYIESQEIE